MNMEEGSTEGDEAHSDGGAENPSNKFVRDRAQSNRNLFNPKDEKLWETSEVKEMESSMKQELRRLNHASVHFQGKVQGYETHPMAMTSGYISRPENEEESMTEAEQTGAENDDMNPPIPASVRPSKKPQKQAKSASKDKDARDVRRNLEQMQNKINILTTVLETEKHKMSRAQLKLIMELQDTLTSVQDHIDDATDDLQTYETKMKKLDKEMKSKEEELNESQTKVEKLQKEVENLKETQVQKQREKEKERADHFSDDDADALQLHGSLKKGNSQSSKHNYNTRGQSPGYPNSGSERQVPITAQIGLNTPRKESVFSYANTMSEHLGAPDDMDFHGNQVTVRPLSPNSKAILFRDLQMNDPHLQLQQQYQQVPTPSQLNAVSLTAPLNQSVLQPSPSMMRGGGNTSMGYYELSDPNNGMSNGGPYFVGVQMTEPGSVYGMPHLNVSSAGSAVNGIDMMEGNSQTQRPLISDHGVKVIGGVVIALTTLYIIHKWLSSKSDGSPFSSRPSVLRKPFK